MEKMTLLHKLLVPTFPDDAVFRVERYFCFQRRSLYTLKGKPRVMDVTNRIKAFDDQLAKLVNIDDSRFWMGIEEKVELPDGERECVVVKISRMITVKTVQDLERELGEGVFLRDSIFLKG